MKYLLQKISLLSLSLMLVSSFAVSPALPAMVSYYQERGYDSSQVDLLVSLPSFAIMATLLLNNSLARLLSERSLIISGLGFLALGGCLPVFVADYPVVFLARLLLGLGIGLINARAISIISEFYEGKDRLVMLGYRGSTEVLGSALLTMLVGFLLKWGWQQAFLIYGLALFILALYLVFVPQKPTAERVSRLPKDKLTGRQVAYSLGLALLAAFVISVNSINTLRLPMIIEEKGFGTAASSSLLLSSMMLMGILAGFFFPRLLANLKAYLMPVSFLLLAISLFALSLLDYFILLVFGALLSGFFYSVVLTLVFSSLSENIPYQLLNRAMTIVLFGCNLAGASASLVLKAFGDLGYSNSTIFSSYAVLSLLLAGFFLWKNHKKRPGC